MMYVNKFSPSILDAFQSLLDCESLYEKFYGTSENLSLEEYETKTFNELIDRINKVPFESEAMSKGSCLNEIVDCIVMKTKSTRDDIQIHSTERGIEATHGAYEFYFDKDMCKYLGEYFRGSLCQMYTEASITTKYGEVLLYGYPDYVREDMVYDLKTTSRYEFGKYSKYWQRHLYPYTLTKSGKCKDIKAFEFTAMLLKGGTARTPQIGGTIYPEVYDFNYGEAEQKLRGICEQFHVFLETNKGLIKNTKILGQ